MTKEERLVILSDAEDRALIALSKAEVGAETVDRLLGQLGSICFLQDRLCLVNPCACGGNCKHDAEPPEMPAPEPEPAPEPVKAEEDKPTPAVTLTKDDVIRILTPIQATAREGLIAEVMQEMGFTKLSEIPAARYQELLGKVKEAVAAEGE